jgi:hypothetical protein
LVSNMHYCLIAQCHRVQWQTALVQSAGGDRLSTCMLGVELSKFAY